MLLARAGWVLKDRATRCVPQQYRLPMAQPLIRSIS